MASAARSIVWNRRLANAKFRTKPALTCFYRPLDSLAVFETARQGGPTVPTRYAIRQALDQEYQKYLMRQRADTRQARHQYGDGLGSEANLRFKNQQMSSTEENVVSLKPVAVKRDFFGRTIDVGLPTTRGCSSQGENEGAQESKLDENGNAWISYHEGFSNAVRKPITLDELMRGF